MRRWNGWGDASRAAPNPLITHDPIERARHARGQSFPDPIAVRSGRGLIFVDAVAYPDSPDAVRALLTFAEETGSTRLPDRIQPLHHICLPPRLSPGRDPGSAGWP